MEAALLLLRRLRGGAAGEAQKGGQLAGEHARVARVLQLHPGRRGQGVGWVGGGGGNPGLILAHVRRRW